jgi:hypothetical protein
VSHLVASNPQENAMKDLSRPESIEAHFEADERGKIAFLEVMP